LQVDRIDVVSETRLIVGTGVTTSPFGGQMKWLKDTGKQEVVKQDFKLIQKRVERLLPIFILP
ncbi:MAG: hypothetical protein KAT86_02895, partial [Candidatus Latescibacteria bacterium]|nr:hypothetical protein [Candidatus Latescibacterota bacterium]